MALAKTFLTMLNNNVMASIFVSLFTLEMARRVFNVSPLAIVYWGDILCWIKKFPVSYLPKALFLSKICMEGFPGGAVVENLPANAGDAGSSPGLGRSHVPRSGWAREPWLLSLRVWSLCSATREAATVRGPRTAMKSGPHLPQLEKALAQKRRPNTAKNK